MNPQLISAAVTACFLLGQGLLGAEFDVVVYGGTSAGVMAAVQAKKLGKTAIIVCPDKHLGGLSSGGLGFTDTGNKAVIGGLAREFYHRVWKSYDRPEAWRWQKKDDYGNKGQGTPAIDGKQRTMWIFEPHVAEQVFEDLIMEYEIPVHRDEWLDRAKGVKKSGERIESITVLSGKTYAGKMFIDATYEGDLMAAAGVDHHVGREAQSVYGEQWNGVQTGVLHHRHHFGVLKQRISPYVIPGDPSSGLLPRVSPVPPGVHGQGDKRVQAYCFRMCLTDHPDNLVPFPKPDGYDPKQYELLLRIFEAGWRETFDKFDPIPNRKSDTNNHGPMSTDNIGANYDYPEASYERRREIIQEHETYQKGWLYFIANDPRVPRDVQEKMRRWGLAKDEFTNNGHWPHQIYVREARRMIGQYVMTENELLKKRPTPDSVGMGSYTIDSHNVQRYITPEGYVQNEGDIGVPTKGPYEIAYGALVPKRGQCENLLVPVCVSSSHIAFGSIRMEPVFMILGQSAATAGALAIEAGIAVQEVPYARLRERLLKDGQILEAAVPSPGRREGLDPAKLNGVVVDDSQAQVKGRWTDSSAIGPWIGRNYRHDGNARDGKAEARFETRLPKSGSYEVRLAYTPNENRASRVQVEVHHASGRRSVVINQKQRPPIDDLFVSLGVFEFIAARPAAVVVSNHGTDGYVIIDAVQWVAR
ncbi:MAG: FAD-dependent oxidoreductase [Verrucomicrobia bacterium]|nr:FAD-dependent oxidoreductase [Verrucomicrobiota bacterium]